MRNWLGVSAAVVVLDLLTKHLVLSALAYGEHITLAPYLDLVRFHNTGAAFSLLAGAGTWARILFSTFAIVASVVIVSLLRKHAGQPRFCLALSLILGGALGNLYDRITLGYVVDFLYFHVHAWSWPAFNVADAAICIGVGLLLLDHWRSPAR